jgi:hypothetical protein
MGGGVQHQQAGVDPNPILKNSGVPPIFVRLVETLSLKSPCTHYSNLH